MVFPRFFELPPNVGSGWSLAHQGQRVGCQKRYARRRLRPAAESHCTALLTVTHASFACFWGKLPGSGDGFFLRQRQSGLVRNLQACIEKTMLYYSVYSWICICIYTKIKHGFIWLLGTPVKIHTCTMSLFSFVYTYRQLWLWTVRCSTSNLGPISPHGCETDPLMEQVLISNPPVTNMARYVKGYVLTKLLLLHLP